MKRRAGPILGLVAVLAVLACIAVAVAPVPSESTDPGSRAPGKAGTLAAYAWLGRLGFTTSRLSGSLDLAGADVVVINQPTVDVDNDDAGALAAFLNGGGEVILAGDGAGMQHAARLLGRLGIAPAGTGHGAGMARTVQPLDVGGSVHDVRMGSGPSFRDDPHVAPLLQIGGDTVAIGGTGGPGRGRLFLVGSALPLSNDGLRMNDAAGFVLAMAERGRGGRIAFDEVHHGELTEPGASDIWNGPVGLAGLLSALVVLLYIGISGRRLGKPVPAGDPSRVPGAREYVGAMAALIERSHHRGGVAERYADELKRRVAAVAAIDPSLSDADFIAALQGYPADRITAVEDALATARGLAASRPSEATLVQLAQHIDALERLWSGRMAVTP